MGTYSINTRVPPREGGTGAEREDGQVFLVHFSGFSCPFKGSRDGAVVRALASHQCGPGSIPGLGVICGLSLLLVLVLAPRVFLRVLRFSSLL